MRSLLVQKKLGKNETTVDANVDGNALTIAFNVKFMREVLDAVNSPNVAIETTVPNAPALIRQLDDERFIHVIMPMHIGNALNNKNFIQPTSKRDLNSDKIIV